MRAKPIDVAPDRPREQALGVGQRLVRGGQGTAVDDLLNHRDDVAPADVGDRAVAPAGDELAANTQLDRPRGALARHVPGNELLGHASKRI